MSTPARAVVIGTSGTFDHIIRVDQLPEPASPKARMLPSGLPGPAFGGCGFNIAVALARLGESASIVSPIGDDFENSGYPAHLAAAGVDTSSLVAMPCHRSSLCYMIRGPRDEAYVLTSPIPEDAVEQIPLDRFEPALATAQIVVVTPHANAFSLGLAEIAGRHGVPIVVSGLTAHPARRAAALAIWRLASIAVLNAQEWGALKAVPGFALGDRLLFVTDGAQGSKVVRNGNEIPIAPARAAHVVEQTGAGDAFTAGVVAGLLHGLPPAACARIGSVVASFAVEGHGAQTALPSRAAVEERHRAAFGFDLPLPRNRDVKT